MGLVRGSDRPFARSGPHGQLDQLGGGAVVPQCRVVLRSIARTFGWELRRQRMTYSVNDKCIKCKYTDCVEVWPVDCFYEDENMLVIHPDECVDCGVCEPECPVEAIKPDTDPGADKWLELNREYSEKWPNITQKKAALPDADAFKDEDGKYEKYFSEQPGEGD